MTRLVRPKGGAFIRAAKLRFGLIGVAALFSALAVLTTGGTAATLTNFSTGSLIIPMDTDSTGNHATYNQNYGMWRAYGLVYKLLQSGIPVQWAISPTKASTSDVDVSVSSVKDERTGTSLSSWDYRGGPFIVDSAYASQALPIITAWWSANGNQPNVHEAQASFQGNIQMVLTTAPRIANEAVNVGVTAAYYNTAGIPDANGNPWSSTSPNVLTESQIASGGLFTQGAACAQPKYDIFVTPHNGGYAYSFSDPTNLGTATYAQLDTFVQKGGGWTALCHSILSNENAIAQLTTNGTASVKALFKTSQPGGVPGGFLTTTGFSSIDNTGGTWNVLAPGLPTAQGVPTSVANTLPGGSVQTWPAPGNAGAPTYYANTSRVATFTSSGVSHDNIITGVYHNGSGAGRLTYIGGHSFGTTLPYSSNVEAPYLRAFYNSLLFNGGGTAKLDLTLGTSSYPQNGTGLLTVSIKNIGASTANNVSNAGITLASGFTYVGTVSGPAPTVSGQTLVWGNLGDVAGGATPVTFQVSVNPSVSGTTGSKQLGTLSATFADDFGGTFTAGVCKDVTIAPVPVPALSKTPTTQGPVGPGEQAIWTLTYGNVGGGALQSGVVQDTLPPGFVYVSSSSSPSLGAPTVIPGTRTIVRWSPGTVAANTASAGTITITGRAGAVTSGTGSPPRQTFTNDATLAGSDASGKSYSASASATVDVQALDISLDKTVDNAFISTLPGSATYTMTPRSDDDSPLSNVRVIDPLPAGIVSAPTVGQGGSYGAYSPIAAVDGDDGAGLTTAISVGSPLVTTGAAVTVTLDVKSTSAISGVSPGAMTATGGGYTCGNPSPTSANVPAGGSGVNFTFSCTTDGLGEYVFSDDAADAGTNNWPAATSASVLSVAGGGSNVALWNLGSNTNAVPGQTVTSGYTNGIYGLRGGATTTFQKFDTSQSSWSAKASTSASISTGGALTTDGAGAIYALGGNSTQAFYAYTASSNTWATKASTGTNVKDGGSLVFLNVGGTKYVFATIGNNTKTFKRYDVANNTWSAMTSSPASIKGGGSLTTDGTNIFLVVGNNTKSFYRYNVASDTWTALASLSQSVSSGGASAYLGGSVYVLRGKTTNGFYRYSVAGNTWSTLATAPAAVISGGALATDGTNLYAFQGGSTAFWRYNVSTNKWTTLPSFTAVTGAGGSLVYMTGVSPQGRFSSIDVTRSLGATGDTVDIKLSLTSSTSVDSVGSGSLTVTPANGASCSTLTGPTLTSADSTSSSTNDPVIYQWTCTLSAGSSPGSLTFSDATVTGSGPVSFPAATSMSVLVSPPLTMQVTVPNGAPNPVQDTSLLLTDQAAAASPTVSTWSGPPAFTITKTTSPSATTTLHPGDPITYTMTVQNSGTGNGTTVTISDTIPSQTTYVDCSGGTSCSNSSGTVTWNVGSLAPGDIATVNLTVATRTNLAVSDTDYTVSNSASVASTEVTTPTTSNTVTNALEVKPEVVKLASAGNAGNGDTVTYTVQVSNPGAAFASDVTDPIPAGASFDGAGTCSPSCSFAGGTVSWSSATIQPGTNTFTFDATITATGGSTVTNSATVDPTSPNLVAIASNSVDTEVGPSLEVVKLGDRNGRVTSGDVITYTLVVTNESRVAATGATVTDPLPASTSYVTASCTTPVGSCSYSNGDVSWTLGTIAASASLSLSFQLRVGTGTTQVSNLARVAATNSPTPVDSNYVDNGVTSYPLTAAVGAGQGTVTADTGGVSCSDSGGTCSGSYGSGTVVTLTAAGRNGQQFTGWSGDCSGSTPSCQLTMDQARNATASFATPPAAPDLVLVKTHAGDLAQGGTGSYTLTASNIGGTQTSASVSVVDNPPSGLTVTGISGSGWTCDVPSVTCSRSDALAAGDSYAVITVTVSVATNAAASVTNQATVSDGGESNTGNDSASDLTTVTPHPSWPLTVSVTGSGSVDADSGAVSGCTSSGGVCSDSYDDGTVVTLTATPAAHHNFAGWGGACSGSSTSCQVTLNQARNVSATFTVYQPDLTIAKSHTGSFTEAGSGSYSLLVSNLGADPSYGTVSVTDNPPTGMTVTAISGSGWTCDLPSATCTRSETLSAGASYPALTVAVAVDGNAAASLTNHATVAGGGDQNGANNTASDPTTITPQQFPLTANVTGSGSVAADTGAVSGCSSSGGICTDNYDNGTLVTLTATPAAHYNFTGWGGACTGTTTCQVTMDQARNVSATFTIYQPDLTVAKNHTGLFTQAGNGTYVLLVSNLGTDPSYGTVTVADNPPSALTVTGMSGTGWTCDVPTATCSRSDALAAGASYPAITVTVAVDGDAAASLTNHASVAGGGDIDGTNNTASDPTTITPQQFPLTVAVTGSGTVGADGGAVSNCTSSGGVCTDTYDNSTVVTLTATPAAHHSFSGWDGACSGTATTCHVTMDQARNVGATFTVYHPDLTIAKSHSGSFAQAGTGTYTLLVSNVGEDPSYGTVSVVDGPPTGLTVTGLSGIGWSCVAATATCTRSDALAPLSSYAAITVTVSVSAKAAANVTNQASVSGGGDISDANNTASDPTTIAPQQFPLKVFVGGAGQVDADKGAIDGCTSSAGVCADGYDTGTLVTLTAKPAPHYPFTDWSGACTGTATTCQVTMDQARNVTATFEPANTTLTVHVKGSGFAMTIGGLTCATTCATPYDVGTSVRLSAKPAPGWRFVGWSGNCNGTQGICAVQMTEDRAVTAIFVRNAHELKVKITGSGSGRVKSAPGGVRCGGDCDQSYDEGRVVTLVATPSKTSVFESFKGCDRVEGHRCTVTMDKARRVVVGFASGPKVSLLVPSRLVFHMPYDHAVVTAHAEFDGHPVRGVAIRATFRCPGERTSVHRGLTDAKGNIHFTEARPMVNAVRILHCVAAATAKIAGYRTHGTGSVRFVHPYWLKVASQAADGSHVVIAAFGRPGSLFRVRVNGKVVARAKIGKSSWVNVPLPTARPGDIVELAGVGSDHFSHAISLGMTPRREIVH